MTKEKNNFYGDCLCKKRRLILKQNKNYYMKKKIALLGMGLVISLASVMAQQGQGGDNRLTVQERITALHEKLVPLNLDKDKLAKTDSVFVNYYTTVQKKREEMMAAGNMDRDEMRSKMQEYNKVRDEQLKLIFTEDQYKKWKDEIEPTMRPQRKNTPQ